MSVDFFRTSNFGSIVDVVEAEEVRTFRDVDRWSPEQFAHEQIRGLVRQVFFSNIAQPVRQVLFTAVEAQTDLAQLCRQVGEALALEIKGSVAVLGRNSQTLEEPGREADVRGTIRSRDPVANPVPLRDVATRLRENLWLLTGETLRRARNDIPARAAFYSRMCELRTEFDYSIVEGPPAGLSSEALALGQLTDGVVLVLSAHKTRRAAAKKIKETLEAVHIRILGAVLNDRTFPIPNALYRRL
jgi:hypothetical protein